MHYQSKLLPIDNEGRFLLAICHGEHAIGGEDTRETQYARFLAGQVGQLRELREISSACLPPRPASAARFSRRPTAFASLESSHAQRLGSTGSLSSASTPHTHSWTRYSASTNSSFGVRRSAP